MGEDPGTGVGGWTAGKQEGREAAASPSHTLGQTLWPLSMAAPRGPQKVPKAFPLEGRSPDEPWTLLSSAAEPHASRWPWRVGSEPWAAANAQASGAQIPLRQVCRAVGVLMVARPPWMLRRKPGDPWASVG